MDYGGVHMAAKFAVIPTVLGIFVYIGSWKLLMYISAFSMIAYVMRKYSKKKE